MAIDLSGNAWVGNYETIIPSPNLPYSLFEFSNSGTLLSGANGYTGGGLDSERRVAIDSTGDVWTVNTMGNSVSKFSGSGVPLSGSSGFTGGGMAFPINIAMDPSGNAWVTNGDTNNITKLSNSGTVLSGTTGFSDGGKGIAFGIAIDGSGSVWVTYPDAANNGLNGPGPFYNRVAKFNSAGKVLSGSGGFTGNGVGNSESLAIDGAGNVWSMNYYSNYITELSNSGTLLSGANGYVSSSLYAPYAIAIDGSGNAWVTSGDIPGSCNLVEYIGIAVPVVTPLSVGVKNNTLGTRP